MKQFLFLLLAGSFIFFSACQKGETKIAQKLYNNGPTDSLKLNQIQVIASHNSYHLKTDSDVFAFMESLNNLGLLPSQYNPDGIDYSHATFEEQFNDYKVRGLELDIYNDPNGGQFYYRMGKFLAGGSADSHQPELNNPGFKIIHIPDFDFNTPYLTFKSALQTIYNWSVAHPNHLPIFINIETKEETVAAALPSVPNLTKAVPFDNAAADNIDEEIKSVFGENLDKVITPDDVRGPYSTLEQAALAGHWPTLAEARNKVVFILEGAAENEYKSGHPSLAGRAVFVYSNPGTPEAAFVILNNPTGDKSEIQQRVQQGYIVRTRADAGTTQARDGDYTDMNAAFESWAQIVSTDYYRPDPRAGTTGWTNYHVQFPNGELARINGISAADKQDLGAIKE